MSCINAAKLMGKVDILFITLDTLRYDVAEQALQSGRTPNFARVIPNGKWEQRHTPGSFTYAAHHAFFAGFLPTPSSPGKHDRLFATEFHGSESISNKTAVFNTPNIMAGVESIGYRTICIGGVGFFNQRSPLSSVIPSMFQESYWTESFGVTDPSSTENQVAFALNRLQEIPSHERVFLFVNVSAIHQPNCIFGIGKSVDSAATQIEALSYVDQSLTGLWHEMSKRSPGTLCVACSDHGTAYGEDGYHGHRLAHDVVWNVPYAEFQLF